eukprot:354235-Pleurochrysis_carterae.AAC.1
MAAAVFLEEVAWVELGLREALRLHELLLGRPMPDVPRVGLAVQRLQQSPHDWHAAVVEESLSRRWSYMYFAVVSFELSL